MGGGEVGQWRTGGWVAGRAKAGREAEQVVAQCKT